LSSSLSLRFAVGPLSMTFISWMLTISGWGHCVMQIIYLLAGGLVPLEYFHIYSESEFFNSVLLYGNINFHSMGRRREIVGLVWILGSLLGWIHVLLLNCPLTYSIWMCLTIVVDVVICDQCPLGVSFGPGVIVIIFFRLQGDSVETYQRCDTLEPFKDEVYFVLRFRMRALVEMVTVSPLYERQFYMSWLLHCCFQYLISTFLFVQFRFRFTFHLFDHECYRIQVYRCGQKPFWVFQQR
jgi:hypothetical protein